jgi:hypothetical protein
MCGRERLWKKPKKLRRVFAGVLSVHAVSLHAMTLKDTWLLSAITVRSAPKITEDPAVEQSMGQLAVQSRKGRKRKQTHTRLAPALIEEKVKTILRQALAVIGSRQ